MYLITIKELEQIIKPAKTVEVDNENGWIVVSLDNGIRIKFRDWK